jgi:hypothetical protein
LSVNPPKVGNFVSADSSVPASSSGAGFGQSGTLDQGQPANPTRFDGGLGSVGRSVGRSVEGICDFLFHTQHHHRVLRRVRVPSFIRE